VSAIAGLLRELAGLFVEDGALALAIVAVVVLAGLFAALASNLAWVSGAVLLVGCLGVLFFNVMKARRR
jgi:hypothetical protein